MKQNKRKVWADDQPLPAWAQKPARRWQPSLMNRHVRRLLILLLAVMMIAAILGGLAAWRPIDITWNMRVLGLAAASRIDARIILVTDDPVIQSATAGGPVYLNELVKAVEPVFMASWQTDRPVSGQVRYRIDARVQAHEPGDKQPVLLQVSENILEETVQNASTAAFWQIDPTVRIDLDHYRELAVHLTGQSEMPLVCDLALVLTAEWSSVLQGGPIEHVQQTTLLMTLDQPLLQLSTSGELNEQVYAPQRQNITYRIHLERVPFFFFPIAAGLCLLSLILLLLTTQSQKPDRFFQQLRRMLRQARGQVMMIGDKAWDPAWCIRSTDYRSLVRTARTLKHPIFCYVDDLSAWPVAYFYIYFGENNYCHIFTEHPDMLAEPLRPATSSADEGEAQERPVEGIPVLPESDDLPDAGFQPEIKLVRPDEDKPGPRPEPQPAWPGPQPARPEQPSEPE